MWFARCGILVTCLLHMTVPAVAGDGNRLTYLGSDSPYYVSHEFPKLITPQWVGDDAVEAVVVLAIDDMRDSGKAMSATYENYLRPILQRLKQIDGRAPVSIMTNRVVPDDDLLPPWLDEGLTIDVHTIDHPCPLLQKSDFAKAKSTYDRCIDMLGAIPNNNPVAYRMPCCDSLNTVSPRFFSEIFNDTSEKGRFLHIDSSVFNIFTSHDPQIPRELIFDADGKEKFGKYVPYDRSFVNSIENYPYPYVINRLCWEFPCVTPSDWSAQHYHKEKCSPKTVRDLKAAIDITVIKQGVLNLVFHPHGWIRNDQIIELIDHTVEKHGRKVKFLTFGEALNRLNDNLLDGQPLRDETGRDNGVRLLDVNHDGFLDVVVGNRRSKKTRIWSPEKQSWSSSGFPALLVQQESKHSRFFEVHFSVLRNTARPTVWQTPVSVDTGDLSAGKSTAAGGAWCFNGTKWVAEPRLSSLPDVDAVAELTAETPTGIKTSFRDLDGDGINEVIVSARDHDTNVILQWSMADSRWKQLPFKLPEGTTLGTPYTKDGLWKFRGFGTDAGLRFVDINEDGFDDIVFSNAQRYSIHLFDSMQTGWSRQILSGTRGDRDSLKELPMIVRGDGTNNGFWVHSRHLWWQNEDTATLDNLVDRRSFDDLLQDVAPGPRTPQASLKSMVPRPGFKVELVAAEPMVLDPVAFDWGPDGRLWVVEMADYPLGLDGQGKPGGRVRVLEDRDADGTYDKSTVFLDRIGFPSGVMPWRNGVLVTAAPDIFYAEDTTGDGRADHREILFTGFGQGNQQHRLNGFTWGLDNWVYCANGDSGGRVKSVRTGKSINLLRHDIRILPDVGEIEKEMGSTQFGRSRDDWGNWFGSNNSHPMWQYMFSDRYLRRNPYVIPPEGRRQVSVKPGASPCYPVSRTLPRFNFLDGADHFTSACSSIVYRDQLFGEAFVGNSFVSEPVHNLIHREVMSAEGVVFNSRRADDEQQSEFLASRDNWFRPTTIKVGPDGALYIADMYREVIEHTQYIPRELQKDLAVRAGEDRGRIYRVYPAEKTLRRVPRFDRMNTAELVQMLESPGGWQRDTVQRLLIHREDAAAVALLETMVVSGKHPEARLHALCTLDGLKALKAGTVLVALADSHPGVRRHAVRLGEEFADQSDELAVAMRARTADTDPHVRLQLAYSLGQPNDSQAGAALGRLAQTCADDQYLSTAIISSLNSENIGEVLNAVLASPTASVSHQELVVRLLRQGSLLGNHKVLNRIFDRIAESPSGKDDSWRMHAVAEILEALHHRGQSQTESLIPEIDVLRQEAFSRLSGLFGTASQIAVDENADETERVAAIRLMAREEQRHQSDLQILAGLLEPRHTGEIQLAAVQRLGELQDEQIPALLLSEWKSMGPELRSQVLDVLFSRTLWSAAILDAMEQEQFAVGEINATRRGQLINHPEESIRQRATHMFSTVVDAGRHQVVADFRSALTLPPDAERGKQVYRKVCSTCHKLDGFGHQVGPDLASLKDKSSESLLIAVLDPNRNVESKYINYVAVTDAGKTHSGILAEETGAGITLLAPKGERVSLLRNELELLRSTAKSTMPEGLEKDLNTQDLADVIAYVRQAAARKVEPNQRGWFVRRVRPGQDNSFLLLATECEVYGDTLTVDRTHDSLGHWQTMNDRAVWPIYVARGGRYEVWATWACDRVNAGNSMVIECSSSSLTHEVAATGSGDTYQREKFGTLDLSEGAQRLAVRPRDGIKGVMIDLKSLQLVPVTSL
ncbi:MAG: c-type cytochrome [Fuerstiella sp.]|nr:c-type cytochrome [Fuerstiella sp.]